MKTPTLPEFKQWARNHKSLALAVCATKAYAEVTRERVDAYIAPIFATFNFQYSGEITRGQYSGPVPSPDQLYLCDDPRIDEFYAACTAEHKRQGFNLPDGYCPALVAEHELIKAENAMIDAAKPLFGIGIEDIHFENRDKYLDLLLGVCLIKSSRRAA